MAAVETAFVGANVPAEQAEQFAEVAARNDRSVSAELRRAIAAHIDSENAKAKAQAA